MAQRSTRRPSLPAREERSVPTLKKQERERRTREILRSVCRLESLTSSEVSAAETDQEHAVDDSCSREESQLVEEESKSEDAPFFVDPPMLQADQE